MGAVELGFEHGFGYSTLMRLRWRTKWLCYGETSAATVGRLQLQYPDAQSPPLAHMLALQWRDIGCDWRRIGYFALLR